VAHGGPAPGEEGLLDFSASVNPYGPWPLIRKALCALVVDRYPEPTALAFRTAVARRLGLSPEQIRAGNGSTDLLFLTCLAFLGPRDRALVVGPAFGEYARFAHLAGARVEEWRAEPPGGPTPAPEALEDRLRALRPRVLFLARPANPTGDLFPAELLRAWVERFPGTLFVVDEAFIEWEGEEASVLVGLREIPPNLLVLRSMTKVWGLAGLRLGYAVGHPQTLHALDGVRPPWSVNAFALEAGRRLMERTDLPEACLRPWRRARRGLERALKRAGLQPLPSRAPYFLLPVGDGSRIQGLLLQQGLKVRDCASFGLPEFVRISPRRPRENARLVQALRWALELRTL